MKHESYELAEFKAVTDGPKQGLFAALVSVFGNVDRNGDRVMPGAFAKSIKRWREKGKPVPVVWSHEWKDPDAYIGSVDPADLRETKDGLVVAGRFFVDDNPKAAKIYDLLASGHLSQWSFGYEVKKETRAKDLARNLHEVDLFELGPTLVGANADTQTIALKEGLIETPEGAEEAGQMGTEPEVIGTVAVEVQPVAPDGTPLDEYVTKALEGFEAEMGRIVEAKIGRAISAKTEARIRAALAELDTILSSLSSGDGIEEEEEKGASPDDTEAAIEAAAPTGEDASLRLLLDETGAFIARRR